MLRLRNPCRCATVTATWFGVFAVLLLLLKQLPAALPIAKSTDHSTRYMVIPDSLCRSGVMDTFCLKTAMIYVQQGQN